MGLDYVNQLGKATPEKNLQNLQKVQKGLLKVLKVLFLVIQLRQIKTARPVTEEKLTERIVPESKPTRFVRRRVYRGGIYII